EVEVIDACAGDGQRMNQLQRMRRAEVEPVQTLGHDDGVTAVRGEVEVVRIVNRNRTARTAGTGIDRCQGVTHVVVHVQGLQVMRRGDVLRQGPDCEVIHDLEGVRIDDVDRVSGAVGHVDAGRIAPGDRLDHSGLVVRVEVEPAGG